MCTHLNLMFQVRFLGAQRAPLLSGRRGGAHSAAGRLHSARAGRQQVTIGKHDLPDGCFTVRRLGCAFRSMPSAQELRHRLSRRWLQNPFRGARAPEPRHSPQRGPACALSMSAANRRLAQPQAPSRARVPAYALAQATLRARRSWVPREMLVYEAARVRVAPGTSAAPPDARDSMCRATFERRSVS